MTKVRQSRRSYHAGIKFIYSFEKHPLIIEGVALLVLKKEIQLSFLISMRSTFCF